MVSAGWCRVRLAGFRTIGYYCVATMQRLFYGLFADASVGAKYHDARQGSFFNIHLFCCYNFDFYFSGKLIDGTDLRDQLNLNTLRMKITMKNIS